MVLVESWGILKGTETHEQSPHGYREYYPTKTKIEKTPVNHTGDAAIQARLYLQYRGATFA